MVYSPYRFATPLANGVKQFGMWVPNTEPSGSGLVLPARFRGQEGAAADTPMHRHLGVIGVTGFLMQDATTNPLDYFEGGRWNSRRMELSEKVLRRRLSLLANGVRSQTGSGRRHLSEKN
jgi:feruloyl esterase